MRKLEYRYQTILPVLLSGVLLFASLEYMTSLVHNGIQMAVWLLLMLAMASSGLFFLLNGVLYLNQYLFASRRSYILAVVALFVLTAAYVLPTLFLRQGACLDLRYRSGTVEEVAARFASQPAEPMGKGWEQVKNIPLQAFYSDQANTSYYSHNDFVEYTFGPSDGFTLRLVPIDDHHLYLINRPAGQSSRETVLLYRTPASLDQLRRSTPFGGGQAERPRPYTDTKDLSRFMDGMGFVAALLVISLACGLFYVRRRNAIIRKYGYDTDNLPNTACSLGVILLLFAGIVYRPLLWAAGGMWLLLLARHLTKMGLGDALTITLMQPFAALDNSMRRASRTTPLRDLSPKGAREPLPDLADAVRMDLDGQYQDEMDRIDLLRAHKQTAERKKEE